VDTKGTDMAAFHRPPPFRVTMTAKFGEYGVSGTDVKPCVDMVSDVLLAKYRAGSLDEALGKLAHAECCFVDATADLRVAHDEPTAFGVTARLAHPGAPNGMTMYLKSGPPQEASAANGLRLSGFWLDANPRSAFKGVTVHHFKSKEPQWIELAGDARQSRRYMLLQVVNVERTGEKATVVAVPLLAPEPQVLKYPAAKEFVPTKGCVVVSVEDRPPMALVKALDQSYIVESLRQSVKDTVNETCRVANELKHKTGEERAEAKRRIEATRNFVKAEGATPDGSVQGLEDLLGSDEKADWRGVLATFNADERRAARLKVVTTREAMCACHLLDLATSKLETYEAGAVLPHSEAELPTNLAAGLQLCVRTEGALRTCCSWNNSRRERTTPAWLQRRRAGASEAVEASEVPGP
jgi:hypothetical protein